MLVENLMSNCEGQSFILRLCPLYFMFLVKMYFLLQNAGNGNCRLCIVKCPFLEQEHFMWVKEVRFKNLIWPWRLKGC